MVANIRCKEIMTDRLAALQKDQAWEVPPHTPDQPIPFYSVPLHSMPTPHTPLPRPSVCRRSPR